jgi:2-phosphoglycerate kinase
MERQQDDQSAWGNDLGTRTLVEGASGRHPFMRGIMIHSLMARGISFEEAYKTAVRIRERIRDRQVVPKDELSKAVFEMLGPHAERIEHQLPALDITITGGSRGRPFSKGILSQSLLAAAIDPNDAFDVARDIERDLVNGGVREIHRRDLRSLAYTSLIRRINPLTADRYLVWRKYQNPERPVIILLGGTAGVGKTSLALEVARRLGIGRMLSTDSIRQIMRLMLSPELAPAIHGSSYDAHKLLPVEAQRRGAVINGFRAQSATVSVGIRASMDRAVAENTSLVMDGVSILPGTIDLEAYAEVADVIFLVVAALDSDDFGDRFETRAVGAKARVLHRYMENLDAILEIQDHFLELAERYNVAIVDNSSFDDSVRLIIRHVTDTLRKRGNFEPADLL